MQLARIDCLDEQIDALSAAMTSRLAALSGITGGCCMQGHSGGTTPLPSYPWNLSATNDGGDYCLYLPVSPLSAS